MELCRVLLGYSILGLCRDKGKEHGIYRDYRDCIWVYEVRVI